MTPAVTEVHLFNVARGEPETAELWHAITEQQLADWEGEWVPELFKAIQRLRRGGIERRHWPQSRHWDWRRKATALQGMLANPGFGIVCDGLTQGMMIVDIVKHRGRLDDQRGQHLVYAEFVENAPWNRAELFNPPRYRGVGSILIRAACGAERGTGVSRKDRPSFVAAGERLLRQYLRHDGSWRRSRPRGSALLRDDNRPGAGLHREGEVEMKIEISKEWCMRMARHEGDAEIGAGLLAIDPVFDGEHIPVDVDEEESPNVAFGRVRQFDATAAGNESGATCRRRGCGYGRSWLRSRGIRHHRPELRTAYQLANYFKVSQTGFMQVAGLAAPKDARLFDEGVRFAARSESTAELTPEEGAALEAFVAVLSEQK